MSTNYLLVWTNTKDDEKGVYQKIFGYFMDLFFLNSLTRHIKYPIKIIETMQFGVG